MAILTKKDLLDKFKSKFGDDTSDESISLLEDLSDTITDFETKTEDKTNWEEKYKQCDADWRKKYTERFYSAPVKEDKDDVPPITDDDKGGDNNLNLSYDGLFKSE